MVAGDRAALSVTGAPESALAGSANCASRDFIEPFTVPESVYLRATGRSAIHIMISSLRRGVFNRLLILKYALCVFFLALYYNKVTRSFGHARRMIAAVVLSAGRIICNLR